MYMYVQGRRGIRFPTIWYVRPASLRSACAYAQSDQSLCLSLEHSMNIKLLTEHPLEFLSVRGGCTGLSESNLSKCHIVGAQLSRDKIIKVVRASIEYSDQHGDSPSLVRVLYA